jgi:uncharacterized protein with ACT and thioredoxin-like domain
MTTASNQSLCSNASNAVVGLAVLGGVPDIADHVVSVQRCVGSVVVADLWVAGGGASGQGPVSDSTCPTPK